MYMMSVHIGTWGKLELTRTFRYNYEIRSAETIKFGTKWGGLTISIVTQWALRDRMDKLQQERHSNNKCMNTHGCMYAWMHVCMYPWRYVCIQADIYVSMEIYVRMFVCVCITYIYECIYVSHIFFSFLTWKLPSPMHAITRLSGEACA